MAEGETAEQTQSGREQIVEMLPRLRRFCWARTGSRDAGDDLAQATIERALSRIDQWQEGTKFDSWMFRIAQNIHIDQYRAQGRRGAEVTLDSLPEPRGEDVLSNLEARSELSAVRRALATLSEDHRTLLAVTVIEGRSYREAAEIMDIPLGTVMSRLARARRALDRAMHPEFEQ